MDFSKAFAVKIEDVQKPKNPPIGVYTFKITKLPTEREAGDNGQWGILTFPCQAVAAVDVNQDQLAKFGDVGNVRGGAKFMFNNDDKNEFDKSLYFLKEFLVKCVKAAGATVEEKIQNSVGRRFKATVSWRVDENDPEQVYVELSKFLPD